MSRCTSKREGRTGIYVVQAGNGPVKIGITGSPTERFASLQVGAPVPLILHFYMRLTERQAPLVEAAVHHRFRRQRQSGEWFNVAPEKAVAAVLERIMETL